MNLSCIFFFLLISSHFCYTNPMWIVWFLFSKLFTNCRESGCGQMALPGTGRIGDLLSPITALERTACCWVGIVFMTPCVQMQTVLSARYEAEDSIYHCLYKNKISYEYASELDLQLLFSVELSRNIFTFLDKFASQNTQIIKTFFSFEDRIFFLWKSATYSCQKCVCKQKCLQNLTFLEKYIAEIY